MPKGKGRGRGRPPGEQPNVPLNIASESSEEPINVASNVQNTPSKGRGRAKPKVARLLNSESSPGQSSENDDSGSHSSNQSDPPASPDSLETSPLLNRPGYGKAGRRIPLEVNYFKMKCSSELVYHYDIEIKSLDMIKKYGKIKKVTNAEATQAGISKVEHQLEKNIGRAKCKEIFAHLVQDKAFAQFHPVYDGTRNLFTTKPLPISEKTEFTVTLTIDKREKKYQVIVQPVKKENGTNKIYLNAKESGQMLEEALMAFNAIMTHRDPPSDQIQIGRSFFFLQQRNKISLNEGIEIWFGYNQSVHMTHNGPALVINQAAKAFHREGPVLHYISDVIRRNITHDYQPLKDYEINKIQIALKGVRVTTTHLPYKRKYIIKGLTKQTASELKLECNKSIMSVADYFRTKYKPLKYPNLPCLNMNSTTNKTFIPIENCIVVKGQPVQGKLNPVLNAQMIRQTAIPPAERFKAIQNSAYDVKEQSDIKMKNYGLFMDLKMKQVEGRVIAAPLLIYKDSAPFQPDMRGVWRMDGKKFYSTNNISSWVVLSCLDERNCSYQSLKNFAETLTSAGKKLGLIFGNLLQVKILRRNDSSERELKAVAASGASFCVIVLSRRDHYRSYDEIKFIADYKLGFVTQCIEESVFKRMNDQIANNLCLKLNAKLGGVNHVFKTKPIIFYKPFIVLGADVVHAPRGSGCPSIASVVGSLDAIPSKYRVACRVQENPDQNKVSQELILDIGAMVESIFTSFQHHTRGKYPEKVIFFRDGVSEGQFEKVRDYEVKEVQKACKNIFGFVLPITFVIVQKRHQTRLRPRNPADGIGKGGNVPPGTTLDTDITHPNHFDFYLNSHEGIQGTSKPAHYTVLYDDNNFDADEIQLLCYHLCYMYVKCNRSISIPAPVQYADLACYRAKKYADFHLQQERETASSFSSSSIKLPDHVKKAIETMGDYKCSMFYV